VAPYALEGGGQPLLLLSSMAEHTRNALADPRASLLVTEDTAPGTDPLAGGRVTVVGRLAPIADEAERHGARVAYLDRHPLAALYVDYADFAFFRLTVTAVRYVGGFGRMSWVDAAAYAGAEPDPLRDVATGVVEHMNTDHADALVAVCRTAGGQPGTTAASVAAVDRYGLDLVAVTPAGQRSVRVAFDQPLASPDPVRQEVVALVRRARRQLSAAQAESSLPPEGRKAP
jgi:putative heme iron utilization protein